MNTARANTAHRMAGIFACLALCVCLAATSGCQRITEPSDAVPGGAAHKIDVVLDAFGPVLTLTNEYMDPIVSTVLNPPPTIITIPSGIPLVFCWTAEPSPGGDPVEAYRYGSDIFDLNDPDSWDVGWIPFDGSEVCATQRPLFFGSHTFTIEVKDAGDNRSHVGVIINIVPGPPSFDILPGSCRNPFNPRSRGLIPAVIPGTVAMDGRDIDASTVQLWIGTERIDPVRTRIGDIAAPVINGEFCECSDGPDGIDDLVLMFSTRQIAHALGPVSAGDVITIFVRGEMMDTGFQFDLFDCVRTVGNPTPDENPLKLRDGVLTTLQSAYNQKNFDAASSLFDDDFIFFFSPTDIANGDVSFAQWDKSSELAATASLFDAAVHTGTRIADPDAELSPRGAAVEDATWGRTKHLFFTAPPGGFTGISLSLLFPPGEGTWNPAIPDPVDYPGEVWYEKTVDYLLTVETGGLILGNFPPTRASFVVRPVEDRGETIWQLVRWRDDI
ncbi:MAG: hypothetical protein V3V49_06615 [Candidatus Krumholzibacteria bacterium]